MLVAHRLLKPRLTNSALEPIIRLTAIVENSSKGSRPEEPPAIFGRYLEEPKPRTAKCRGISVRRAEEKLRGLSCIERMLDQRYMSSEPGALRKQLIGRRRFHLFTPQVTRRHRTRIYGAHRYRLPGHELTLRP